METALPTVLIVGGATVGKKTLFSRITGSACDQTSVLWTIDTKYYTARATLEILRCISTLDQSMSPRDCEALILVFDANWEETYREVKGWLANHMMSPEITLLLANKAELLDSSRSTAQRQPWHAEAQDWCCDQLFEYIEVTSLMHHIASAHLVSLRLNAEKCINARSCINAGSCISCNIPHQVQKFAQDAGLRMKRTHAPTSKKTCTSFACTFASQPTASVFMCR